MASTSTTDTGSFFGGLQVNWSGFLWFLLLVVAPLPIFGYGMVYLAETWTMPEYSHGPLIPLISLYLFLRELRDKEPLVEQGSATRLPGFIMLALGLALGAIGTSTDMPDFTAYGIIVWMSGVVLTVFGWSEGKRHQLPVLHLVFMLPLPSIAYYTITPQLQLISSEVGVAIVSAFGIPVYLEGNIIDLGVYKLHVAEACSGLRYLFPILSFSYLTAILYKGPMWHKFLLFFSAAPIAIIMNAVRVGMIGILVNYYGIEHAEGFTHFFEGWVVFLICIAILFAMVIGLQRLTAEPKSLAEAVDLDFNKLHLQFAGVLQVTPTRGLAFAAIASTAVGAAFLAAPERELPLPERRDFAEFPMQFDEWAGRKSFLDERVEYTLGADDYVQADFFTTGSEVPVNFFAAYYEEQSKGDGLHSPVVCLPGAGWEIFSFGRMDASFSDTIYGDFKLNRAVIQKGMTQQLVYYWFEQRGKRFTNDYLAKLSVVVDGVLMGRSDGAMVRFVTPIVGRPETAVAEADARMQAFMKDALPHLQHYIPE
ncbi:MAG: VPLPA-CTERM-specific exosortase XrtD [Pseudomonadota bacterium]